MKLLLIDDDVAGVSARELLLRAHGHEVLSALTGHAGLELIEKHPIDLVILDLELPDCKGLDLLQVIKGGESTCPVIILSGLVSVPRPVRELADAVLLKGERVSYLLDTLKTFESRRA